VSVRADGSVSLLYLDRDAFNRCVRAVGQSVSGCAALLHSMP
jgi:hypothetical protein